MGTILLDASQWKAPADFYRAILPALGAPAWHGDNINALIDTMIWDNVNKLKPPYVIRICNVDSLDARTRQEVEWAREGLAEARTDFSRSNGRDIDVVFEIEG